MHNYNLNDTICAKISNSDAPAAIGIIRVDGDKCNSILKHLLINSKNKYPVDFPRIAIYCSIFFNNLKVDDVIIIYYKKPSSFTGNNSFEIFPHGNKIILNKIIDLLISFGCRLALPGEFTYRAFYNGKINISQVELLNQIITQENEAFLYNAISQFDKSDSFSLPKISNYLLQLKSEIELSIDFSDQDISFSNKPQFLNLIKLLINEISEIVFYSKQFQKIQNGITVSILGSPNAGKSSVFNHILNFNRSIVTDIPGTTRDVISEFFSLEGYNIKIIDTAGLRKTSNKIEKLGIEKTYNVLKTTNIILYIIDSSCSINNIDYNINILNKIVSLNIPFIILFHKSDLLNFSMSNFNFFINHTNCIFHLNTSIYKPSSISELLLTLKNYIVKTFSFDKYNYIPEFKLSCLNDILINLNKLNLEIINNSPIEIISENLNIILNIFSKFNSSIPSEEVLNNIFSKFCIGK